MNWKLMKITNSGHKKSEKMKKMIKEKLKAWNYTVWLIKQQKTYESN